MPRKHRLIEIDWPEFGEAVPPPTADLSEYEARLEATRAAMDRAGLSHLIIYGDREHFANLAYLTNFDPRFEESLLIVRAQADPLLLVGNECEGYLGISPLYNAGKLRHERFQPFSLISQPRQDSRLIEHIFADEGIHSAARVGCVGWKYFGDDEVGNGRQAIELPAYLVDRLRYLAGWDNVSNATALFMHPQTGLRARCSAAEIAYFEYTNVLASEGLKRMLFGLREGMRDYEVVQLAQWNGEPLSCHITFATGDRSNLGLSGPSGQRLQRGQSLSTNLAYWGSNSCRAGWLAESATDLPTAAQEYVAAFAGPYFEVMREWLQRLRLGTPGHELAELVSSRLPFDKFGIFLNPGHLIHLDEWLSSPIYAGSTDTIQSGMVMQIDVIPSSPIYASTRMEDGVVIADTDLRQEIEARYPDCYGRCQARRHFMQNTLGFDLPDEILPLSNISGLVPPYFLNPHQVFAY
jgi:Xaa-Pro aminopeptidase